MLRPLYPLWFATCTLAVIVGAPRGAPAVERYLNPIFVPPTSKPTPKITPAVVSDLFNNTNIAGVSDSPSLATTFIVGRDAHVAQIITVHFNGGHGATTGTLWLQSSNGRVYGPFLAQNVFGQFGVSSVNWIARVNLDLPAGTYAIVDSDPATWSTNILAGNRGFAIVRGFYAGTGAVMSSR